MASNVLDEFLILFRTRLTGDGIQKVNKQLGHTRNQLFATKNLFKTFFAYDLYGAFSRLIPNLVETTQKLGAMESRFSAVTGQAKTGKEELAWIGEESKRLGLNFLETADNYSIFYATLRNTQGQETTRQIFQQWSEAFRTLHIDPERQGRILYALREMSSKGKIYMSDLAVQLGSAVPDAMQLAAKSMGYFGKQGVQKFRDDIKDGKVNVNEFLKSFSTMVNKTYVNADKLAFAMNKPDAQLQRLATNWQMIQIAFAEAGFEKDLVDTLKITNELLQKIGKNIKPLYGFLKLILQLFAIKMVAGFIDKLIGFAKIGLSLLKNIPSYISAFRTLFTMLSGGVVEAILSLFTPVGWIALIAGLGLVLMYIIHTFFPNVDKALWGYWEAFKTDVKTLMLSIENWLYTLPAFKEYFDSMGSYGNNPKKGDVIAEQWKKRFPNNAFLSKTMTGVDRAIMGASYYSNVKIETTVHVATNASPQEVAEAVAEKQNESAVIKTGRKIKGVIHHFIK